MTGAGSGGSGFSAGYRYSRLSCAPALAISPKCTTSVYAGFEAADLCTEITHLLKTFSHTLVFLIPSCSFACCISNSDVCVKSLAL